MVGALMALALAGSPELPPCDPTSVGPARRADISSSRTRSVLSVCDTRRGRRVVVRRTRIAGPHRGTFISRASAAGRLVAWTEVKVRDGVTTTTVRVASVHGRRVRTLRRMRVQRRAGMGFATAGVAITSRGELAWTLRDVLRSSWRLRLQRAPGRPVRTLARGMYDPGVDVEDDRTLRWREKFNEYLDLRPPRIAHGCPRRPAFATIFADSRVRVTQAGYLDDSIVQRVCVRGSRRDHVIDQDDGDTYNSSTQLFGRRGRWLVQTFATGGRYGTCRYGAVRTIAIATGHRRRNGTAMTCDDRVTLPLPVPGDEFDVSADGVPTWVHDGETWTVRDDGTIGAG